MNRIIPCAMALTLILLFATVSCGDLSVLDKYIGEKDAVLLVSESNDILYQKHSDLTLIPASTLKVLTALSAFHYLGEAYTFKTEFYLDNNNNLIIKGYGDPLLVSEAISSCCDALSLRLLKKTNTINDILVDDSFFEHISIPGASVNSTQPYDAVNGALCANFNTVSFTRNTMGQLISAEPQTPLLPMVKKRIKTSGLQQGRIRLNQHESKMYAAHLFRYFLKQKGIPSLGSVRLGRVSHQLKPIFIFQSPYSLHDISSRLLEFSNNFIANQLCLTMGSTVMGAPATLEKGVKALRSYLNHELNLKGINVVEGSGLSRQNKITAQEMDFILKKFYKYRTLMKKKGKTYYKTGTLKGISTRVGYITGANNVMYRFVVFCNTPSHFSAEITHILENAVQ